MNKTCMYSLLVLSLLTLGCSPADAAESQTDSARPNILLIVGDDIGFGDLGISGSVTRTHNLDTLAQQGTLNSQSTYQSNTTSVSKRPI